MPAKIIKVGNFRKNKISGDSDIFGDKKGLRVKLEWQHPEREALMALGKA